MKILSLTAVLATALLGLASCNKQYDTTVSDSQIDNNNNNNGNGGSGFNWTGTAPISAKMNVTPFLATEIYVTSAGGYYSVVGQDDGGSILGASIPVNAQEGKVYTMPTPTALSGALPPNLALISTIGKVKIIANNSTNIEGYFWGDLKDPNGLSDTGVHVTEGYFKVDKP
jgi:hypothetical protein